MSARQPSFSRAELGRLAFRLQSTCLSCVGGKSCVDRATCPIEMARSLIGEHLATGNQVSAEFDVSLARRPMHLPRDTEELAVLPDAIAGLCNRCMFHVPTCFLNLVYRLGELALDVDATKPLAMRPGDAGS